MTSFPGAVERGVENGRTALLTLDMQYDFLGAAGRFPVGQDQVPALIETANRLLGSASALSWLSIRVRNSYAPWDPLNLFRNFASLRGSAGSAYDHRVDGIGTGVEFTKTTEDSLANPELLRYLRAHQVGTVILQGVYADACVMSTALSAKLAGFRSIVVADGVASKDAYARDKALASMVAAGIEVVTSAALLSTRREAQQQSRKEI